MMSSTRFTFIVAWAAILCETTTAGIVFQNTETLEEINIPYIVPMARLLGLQNGTVVNQKVAIMSEERNKIRCYNEINGEGDDLEDFQNVALMLPYGDGFGLMETCDSATGSWSSMKGMGGLCNKTRIILTAYRPGVFPALFTNVHPGDYFESLYETYGEALHDCMVLNFELESEDQHDFLFGGTQHFRINITIDESRAIKAYESAFVQFVSRGLLSFFALSTCVRAVVVIYERVKSNKLEGLHAFLLGSNLFLMVLFGCFQSFGADFLTTNLPYNIHLGLYFVGSCIEVASHYVFALMYFNLTQASTQAHMDISNRWSGRRAAYITIAAFLCLLDLVIVLVVFIPSLENGTLIFVVAPAVTLCLQVLVIGFLYSQVREMVHLLKALGQFHYVKGGEIPKTVLLYVQLSYWVKCTVLFSFCATVSRLTFLLGMAVQSPEAVLFTMFSYKLGIIGSSLSQVQSAKLPSKSTPVLRSWAIRSSAFRNSISPSSKSYPNRTKYLN